MGNDKVIVEIYCIILNKLVSVVCLSLSLFSISHLSSCSGTLVTISYNVQNDTNCKFLNNTYAHSVFYNWN